MKILTKRIYDAAAPSDGFRVLVDRLWPRGISKDRAALALWLKEIAPSTELRKWYNHEPEKFGEFKKRYIAEIKKNPVTAELRKLIADHSPITFLYGAKTPENEAEVLREFFLKK